MTEVHTIVCDGYDREVLARLLARDRNLASLSERLARLLPHADALVCDLFSALFKLNIELRPKDQLAAAALINRRIVQSVLESRDLPALRQRTELMEAECGAALPVLIERIMRALGREFRYVPERLMAASEAAHDQAELEQRDAELETLESLPEDAIDADERDALEAELRARIDELQERVTRARDQQDQVAERLSSELSESVGLKISILPEQLDEVEAQLRSMNLGQGRGGRVDARRRLELGERLLASRKLQLLAKLVGAFRDVANEARRKRVVRAPQELHAVTTGAQLSRLLPSELLGLGPERAALHLDFCRRLVEGKLLQYRLQGASQRGPMVVCVDGSGSMRGSRELWSKAVALTLMDIARREKRRCLAIVFSSSSEIFAVELLEPASARKRRDATRVLDQSVLDFAEYFPGGGTDFETPLRRALDAVASADYRRGDIVFITDGQAHVSPGLLDEIRAKRRKYHFRIRGILVGEETSGKETLHQFCDDVRLVSDLVADSMTDLFATI